MNELIKTLVSQLNINEDQAKGGAGLLFKMAQDKMEGSDFSSIAEKLGGVGDLINAAPKEEGSGGLLGGLTNMASSLGGNFGKLGALASLAGGFKSLNMDTSLISKMAPLILNFIQEKCGDDAAALVKKHLA